jgi:uncharacterized protein (DUF2236 family)
MLGAGRALILQVAHPLVGAGVARHSRYLTDPWGRLSHTLTAIRQITFGDVHAAERAAARIRAEHARVRGVVRSGAAAGRPYDATDPLLVLWVWATLVDTWLVTYQRYVGELLGDEIERFYNEQKRFAYACGVVDGLCPETFADFAAYFEQMVARTLEPTDAAHQVATMTLNPLGLPRAVTPLLELLGLSTVGLLPPHLRSALGLRWSPTRERAFDATAWGCRQTVRCLPPRVRRIRAARRAAQRVVEPVAVG